MTACPALWRPQIWTPRAGSWWRLPHFLTAGKAQHKSSTGKVKRKTTNGKIQRNSASVSTCCCIPPCDTCANCTTTPSYWTVTVADLALKSCFIWPTGSGASAKFLGEPNGTFTLVCVRSSDSFSTPCVWFYVYPQTDLKLQYYSGDTTCTTLSDTGDVSITLTTGAAGVITTEIVAFTGSTNAKAYTGTVTGTPLDCLTAHAGLTNVCIALDCGGTGGTMDITPTA